MEDTQYLDGFICELLHINDVAENKLVDLHANGGAGTYVLTHTCENLGAYALKLICERIGKTGNTLLTGSALSGGGQRVNRQINTFEWRDINGGSDVKTLHNFIAGVRKDLIARGNNPLFLGLGALKWRVAAREYGKDVLKDVLSPFLIFPVRLITSGSTAPVAIEFIDDEIYINPCLIAKLSQAYGSPICDGLPKIGGKDVAEPVNLPDLGDGAEYFARVEEYFASCTREYGEDAPFVFDKNFIAIAQYKHDELCTYYDIRRNREKIYSHPLVEKIFGATSSAEEQSGETKLPRCVLQKDSVQERIISRALGGQSLIVKGPPGTGKTATIANLIASALFENKKILFASKKLSALTEVYAKLPEELRAFCMLLDSETESAAARLGTEEVKRDFKKLLAQAKEYRQPAALGAELNQAAAQRSSALRALSNYHKIIFGEDCAAGHSLYELLDIYCRDELPVINFAEPEEVVKLTAEEYQRLLADADEAEKCFKRLGDGGRHPVYKCPWFGMDLSCDSEAAVSACGEIGKLSEKVLSAAESALDGCGLSAGGFTLAQLCGAAECDLEGEKLLAIANSYDQALFDNLERRLKDFLEAENFAELKINMPATERLEGRVIRLGAVSADKSLNLKEMKIFADGADALFNADGSTVGADVIKGAAQVFERIEAAEQKRGELMHGASAVFGQDCADKRDIILNSAAAFSAYAEECPAKPKALDFKAKKAYAKLCAQSYLKSPSFGDIVRATRLFAAADRVGAEIDNALEEVNKFFCKRLSQAQIDCVRLAVKKCAGAQSGVCSYVRAVKDNLPLISQCYAEASAPEDMTLQALSDGYERAYRSELLRGALEDFEQIARVYDGEKNACETARGLINLGGFLRASSERGVVPADSALAVAKLRGAGKELSANIRQIISLLSDFGGRFFRNYYVINAEDNLAEDLKILSAEADDRDLIAAAARYTSVKSGAGLGNFLYWFEKGGVLPAGATFKQALEHSFAALALSERDKRLGILRNGMGDNFENNLGNLRAAEEKLCRLYAQDTQGRLLSRIKPDDNAYTFVQDRNPNENLRLLFKRHAQEILKLKKCLILSPYSASLLFANGDFKDFDLLIVDEASQLEPALLLPVLFRSKQCVIVGDEWQMPPIKHFVSLAPAPVDGGEEGYSSLEAGISALGLALRNQNLPVEELVCHYRSKTETLIKFSQESFYPNMRTFPAPIPAIAPAKGVVGLGIKDVYVPDGKVALGRNQREAEKVVEELNLHFDNYYDEESKKLSVPVGVVAFGEAQCTEILSRVQADKKLSKKISDALENFGDLPEKLVFFKTIETVQGQETGHLILSLTHGRRESGLYMHFGQLNQGKLGKCIFNVAVTRAQCMVTVIHSVRAAEITGESVGYIKNYLEIVEKFGSEDCAQFVSEGAKKGFLRSVGEFICSLGIEKERVVYNYGATEGSVRIPIAVLNKDLTEAVFAVWCEVPVGGKYDFIDYNMRYKNSLIARGWKIHCVSAHDWVDNAKNEREALKKALAPLLNHKEK